MSDWIPLLCMNKAWEEDRISHEEDWGVITHEIPVAIFTVELNGKATRVTSCVSRPRLTTFKQEQTKCALLFECLRKDENCWK